MRKIERKKNTKISNKKKKCPLSKKKKNCNFFFVAILTHIFPLLFSFLRNKTKL